MTAPPAPPSRSPDRSTMVEVNRTTLRVWEWGDPADPVIIAAHGAYDHGRMLDGMAAALSDRGWHVRVPDLRGHGDSGPIDTGHTFEASILDLGALAATHDGPVGMVAHSMGGSLAFSTAAVWPEHVAWVVSFDGTGPPPEAFDNRPIDIVARESVAAAHKALGRSWRVFADREAMVAQRSAINTRVPAAWMEHLVEHGSFENEGGWSWKWHPLFSTWLPSAFEVAYATSEMELIECPVLLFTGEADDMWSFPADQLPERISHFRDIEHVPVPDAGHYLHLERPDFVLQHMDSFLDRRSGGS